MPSTEVKLDNGNKALDRIVYFGYLKKHFRVAHEAAHVGQQESGKQNSDDIGRSSSEPPRGSPGTHILGYSFQHASRLEDKSRQDDPTKIGARSQL